MTRRSVSSEANGTEPVLVWLRAGQPAGILIAALLVAVLFSGLMVVHATYRNRTVFHELQQLQQAKNALEVQWGQLLIEHSTFGLDGRIERKAAEELDMELPDWSKIIMVRYDREK